MYQQITLLGRLGNDPEMRFTPSGKPVASFSFAVSRNWTTDGERKEKTTWFRITVWDQTAEVCAKFLAKGSQALVVGEFEEARIYVDKAGEQRVSLEVTGRTVKFVGSRADGQAVAETAGARQSSRPSGGFADQANTDEDIPF